MLSCTIDAQAQRDVAIADIPGTLMQADMVGNLQMIGNLQMKMEGKFAACVTNMHETLQAALLFWKTHRIFAEVGIQSQLL